jgi:Tfp pilus assembly protein PilF
MDMSAIDRVRENEFIEEINLRGHDFFEDQKFLVAASYFERCMLSRPDNPTYTANYGACLWQLGRYDEAAALLSKAAERWPEYDDVRENYGKTLTTLERFHEAVNQFDIVLGRNPDKFKVLLQRAFTRLDMGDWEKGLVDYEARRLVNKYQVFPMPQWDGEDLTDKTLYVQSEQGAGDTFLFSRYLWWIKQKWPTCTINLCCHHQLIKPLWQYVSRGIVNYKPEGIPWEDNKADYGTYMMSLPRIHGTRPDTIPLDPGLIEQRCVAQEFAIPKPELGNPLKVGIVWNGNPEMRENGRRSVPIEKFIELSGDPRWMLYSLQVGPGRDDLYTSSGNESICDLSKWVGQPYGFVATGACMAKLDLVITICTSAAHLAGCMGVRTWVLLGKEPYWIWGRHGNTSDWYPSVRLFRQPEFGDWDSVFDELRDQLGKLYTMV